MSPRQRPDREVERAALRGALKDFFPEWNGQALPDFGEPVKVQLPDGRDPVDLLLNLQRRRRG